MRALVGIMYFAVYSRARLLVPMAPAQQAVAQSRGNRFDGGAIVVGRAPTWWGVTSAYVVGRAKMVGRAPHHLHKRPTTLGLAPPRWG